MKTLDESACQEELEAIETFLYSTYLNLIERKYGDIPDDIPQSAKDTIMFLLQRERVLMEEWANLQEPTPNAAMDILAPKINAILEKIEKGEL